MKEKPLEIYEHGIAISETVLNKKELIDKESRSCKNCKDYMKCFINSIGIGADKWAQQCSFYRSC